MAYLKPALGMVLSESYPRSNHNCLDFAGDGILTLDSIVQAIESYGLLVLFLLAVIEGPIATVIGGYVASLGYLNIFAVYCVVVAADLVGDSICYALGRFGYHLAIAHWSSPLGLTETRMAKLEHQFQSGGGKILLTGKLTHAAGFFVLIAAGASQLNFGTYLWFNLLGTLAKSLFLLVVGYTLGNAYKDIDVYISRASFAVLIVGAISGLFYLAHKRRSRD